MKIKTALACLFLSGCVTNSADTAVPAPTNLVGIYKAVIMGVLLLGRYFQMEQVSHVNNVRI